MISIAIKKFVLTFIDPSSDDQIAFASGPEISNALNFSHDSNPPRLPISLFHASFWGGPARVSSNLSSAFSWKACMKRKIQDSVC
jgi:hypothetical protein